jgi:hypothetical protein
MKFCQLFWQNISTNDASTQKDNIVFDKLIIEGIERVMMNKFGISPVVFVRIFKNSLIIYKYPL